jgi:hypothetical protein
MRASNAARAAPAGGRRSSQDDDRLAGSIDATHTQQPQTIQAELRGADRCEALGIAATANAPVLRLCRALLAAGVDADTALEVRRRGVLALRVRAIGEAARLTVEDDKNGHPRFRIERTLGGGTAPPMRRNGQPDGNRTQ